MKQLSLALTILLVGCGVDRADPFRSALPKSADIALKAPGKGQALTGPGTRRDGLEGELSEFYKLTREVTVFVNSGTVATLDLVHHVTDYPATSVSQDAAVWGPHTEPLSPTTWKLSVARTATDTYSYTLEGKAKQEPDTAFRVVLSGTHVDQGQGLGSGHFVIDFSRAQELPEHDGNVGTVTVTYARPSAAGTTQVDADFRQVRDGAALVDAQYRYLSTPGQGGSLEYVLEKDFVRGAGLERGAVHSRWLQSGAGRADVTASGGDLSAPVTLSECWDDGFASRYLDASFDPSQNYGTATVCAFTTAAYGTL